MDLTNSSAIVTTHQTAVTPTQTTCPALAHNTTQSASTVIHGLGSKHQHQRNI